MPDDKKLKKKKRALLGLLVFMPLVNLRKPISKASDDIEDAFDDMFDEYESSASAAQAVKKGRSGLTSAMQSLVGAALLTGYRDGKRYSGNSDQTFEKNIKALAKSQGTKAANQMLGTTKDWLKARGSDGHTLSRDRAEAAARYKASEAYFNGIAEAFGVSKGMWEKSWNTTSDDPCGECLSNEDEEWIPMDEPFQSGHYAPLAHPSCQCFLSTRKVAG